MFLQYYGLREQPFGVTPDPRFLYMGAAQQEAYSSILYGIETGRGFVALIAPPGLGKTTLLMQLMERLRHTAHTAFLFQTHTNFVEFLRSLLVDLQAEPCGYDLGDLQRQLGDVLIQGTSNGKRVVVIVDEAQNLDMPTLEMVRMLSNFEAPQAKLMQIVLAGQPRLADKLASPQLAQLRQRVSIVTHFPPLGGKEVPKYISHRLRVAGYEGPELFSPEALRLIAAESKGIPRNINNLCFQALSLGFAKQRKVIDQSMVREVVGDLSLDTLQTSSQAVIETTTTFATVPDAAGPEREPAPKPDVNQAPPVGTPVQPAPSHQSFEDVRLAPDSWSDDFDTVVDGRVPFEGSTWRQPERNAYLRPLIGVGVAALLVCALMTARVRSGIHSFAGTTNSASTDPQAEVVNPSAAVPPVSGATAANFPPASTAGEPTTETVGGNSTGDAATSVNPAADFTTTQDPKPITSTRGEVRSRASEDAGGSARLVVQSNQAGAQISLNGKSDSKWVTPHLFHLAPGTYVVSLSQGQAGPWSNRVHVNAGQERWINADLTDMGTGYYTVDTVPSGMQVFIDGKAFGPSRVEATLHAGWHVCEVVPAPGMQPLVRKFHLGPGESVTRKIRMTYPEASRGPLPAPPQ